MGKRKRTAGRALWLFWALCVLLGLGSAGFGPQTAEAAQEPDIRIFLDHRPLVSDVAPYLVPKHNVTLVPLRLIGEGIGATVGWDPAAKAVTVIQKGRTIVMTIGQKTALVNGNPVELLYPPQLVKDRTMVPIRFVSEQLGLGVEWRQSSRTIMISTPGGTELRGVWVASVYNLDWPSDKSYGDAEKQKQEYVQLLDELQAMGMNAVFVQVRPAADALYPSERVPWSRALTGVQGQDPGYDPLAFMIAETHRRGMEFHAWFNPFRANTSTSTEGLDPRHVAVRHPEWILRSGSTLYINPGIPEARQHIIDDIMEVVRRYDIDGVHLDDYFYPSGGLPDDDTFKKYNAKNIRNKGDWRRDNMNEFIRMLGEAIRKEKPQVSFGVSPVGVWRNKADDPTGSDTRAGVTAYDSTFADVRTWIRRGWVDYVAPQIYWSRSFSAARYETLVDWWVNEVRGTGVMLYIGHAPYKLGTKETGWDTAEEIVNQLKYNERHPEVAGDLYFSAKDLRRNPLGLIDLLKRHYGL
mgnify:FL=1